MKHHREMTIITPHARRKLLISALRGDMPGGFTWDFDTIHEENECGTVGCAIGLAVATYILSPEEIQDEYYYQASSIGDALGITAFQVRQGLLGYGAYNGRGHDDRISPLEVANWLESL